MEPNTDSSLTQRVKDFSDNEALQELINRHSGIYIQMVDRFASKNLTPFQKQDLMEQKDFEIYRAAQDYNEDKAKFCTFLANRARFLCLSKRREAAKENKRLINFADQEPFMSVSSGERPDESLIGDEMIAIVSSLIEGIEDQKVKTVVSERYFGGSNGKLKPWKLIAEEVGISIQGAIDIHNNTLKNLRKRIQNEQTTLSGSNQ
jgi:DNA-directed RNA polymerase specialized sigma24 family protein